MIEEVVGYRVEHYKAKKQQSQPSRDAEQSPSQHLAIDTAANDNIWIRGAELKGKNVVWALQQQLQTTQKPT